jgi:hypothetical protein
MPDDQLARMPTVLEPKPTLVKISQPSSAPRVVALDHGRSLVIEGEGEAGGELVTLRSPSGEIEIEVVITPEGPRLRLHAVDLALVASKRVTIDCEDLELRCTRDMSIEVGGDQREVIAGNARHEAHTTTIETRRGDLTIRANDDARVEGERVLLNS